jgi:hypothetical protein
MLPLFLYTRGEDYSKPFMTVQNSVEKAKLFLDRIDWMEVHHVACCPKKKAGNSCIKKKRQDKYEYFDSEVLDQQEQRFASRIHEDNVFECMHHSVTNLKMRMSP